MLTVQVLTLLLAAIVRAALAASVTDFFNLTSHLIEMSCDDIPSSIFTPTECYARYPLPNSSFSPFSLDIPHMTFPQVIVNVVPRSDSATEQTARFGVFTGVEDDLRNLPSGEPDDYWAVASNVVLSSDCSEGAQAAVSSVCFSIDAWSEGVTTLLKTLPVCETTVEEKCPPCPPCERNVTAVATTTEPTVTLTSDGSTSATAGSGGGGGRRRRRQRSGKRQSNLVCTCFSRCEDDDVLYGDDDGGGEETTTVAMLATTTTTRAEAMAAATTTTTAAASTTTTTSRTTTTTTSTTHTTTSVNGSSAVPLPLECRFCVAHVAIPFANDTVGYKAFGALPWECVSREASTATETLCRQGNLVCGTLQTQAAVRVRYNVTSLYAVLARGNCSSDMVTRATPATTDVTLLPVTSTEPPFVVSPTANWFPILGVLFIVFAAIAALSLLRKRSASDKSKRFTRSSRQSGSSRRSRPPSTIEMRAMRDGGAADDDDIVHVASESSGDSCTRSSSSFGGSSAGGGAVHDDAEAPFSVPAWAKKLHADFGAEIERGEQLGVGSYGEVYRAVWTRPRRTRGGGKRLGAPRRRSVAVKCLRLPEDEDAEVRRHRVRKFAEECRMMAALPAHPNVMPLLGVALDPRQPIALIMPYAAGGSLDQYVRAHKPSLKEVIVIAIDAAEGVKHLHAHQLVHRDLACRNLLLTHDGVVQVADFGMARGVVDGDAPSATQNASILAEGGGPLKYMAPESIERGEFSLMSDMWSFGVTLWELACRRQPFADMSPAEAAIHVVNDRGRVQRPPESDTNNVCSEEYYRIVCSCLQHDAQFRVTVDGVLSALTELLADESRFLVESDGEESSMEGESAARRGSRRRLSGGTSRTTASRATQNGYDGVAGSSDYRNNSSRVGSKKRMTKVKRFEGSSPYSEAAIVAANSDSSLTTSSANPVPVMSTATTSHAYDEYFDSASGRKGSGKRSADSRERKAEPIKVKKIEKKAAAGGVRIVF